MKTPKKAHVWEVVEHSWYREPGFCTDALLTEETFQGPCWDPCCGQGSIVQALRAAGIPAFGTDIVRRVPTSTEWFGGEVNFLETLWPYAPAPNIVFNPPYMRAWGTEYCIRKAALIPGVRKIAAFVNIRFLAGENRANGFFRDLPPNAIWCVSPRPSCPPGEYLLAGNKAEGGTDDYVWIVWDFWNGLGIERGQRSFGWVNGRPGR